ncbi:MAG: hypothetical protein ACLFRR_11180 [Spirochaetaceae bacterium]
MESLVQLLRDIRAVPDPVVLPPLHESSNTSSRAFSILFDEQVDVLAEHSSSHTFYSHVLSGRNDRHTRLR